MVKEHEMGMDPLFLWNIVEDEQDEMVLYYHFLWNGKIKVYATLAKDEDFFKWFGDWWAEKNRWL